MQQPITVSSALRRLLRTVGPALAQGWRESVDAVHAVGSENDRHALHAMVLSAKVVYDVSHHPLNARIHQRVVVHVSAFEEQTHQGAFHCASRRDAMSAPTFRKGSSMIRKFSSASTTIKTAAETNRRKA